MVSVVGGRTERERGREGERERERETGIVKGVGGHSEKLLWKLKFEQQAIS